MSDSMLFGNPVFQPGLNLTVRNGTKWAGLPPGWLLKLKGVDSQWVDEVGEVVATEIVHFDEIREPILKFEHDPSCRNLEGLRKELDRVYPDGWGPTVTLVFFWVQ